VAHLRPGVAAFGIFAGMFTLDLLWTTCVDLTAAHKALPAASVGAVMHVLQACITIQYVRKPWYVIPAALGGFLGVWLGVTMGPR